jgi:hypothetical protein
LVFDDDPFQRIHRYRRALARAASAGRGIHGRCAGS